MKKTVEHKNGGIKCFEGNFEKSSTFAELDVVLSAGRLGNLNPNLFISVFENRFLVSCVVSTSQEMTSTTRSMEFFR